MEIRLLEKEVSLGDSLPAVDTLLFYHLAGYTQGPASADAVKKEFSKFDRKFSLHFYSEDSVLKKDREPVGLVRNYFFPSDDLSPVTISWAKLDDVESVFTIMFRIKLIQNVATLPQFPDGH